LLQTSAISRLTHQAVGLTETTDALGLIACPFTDQLVAKLDNAVDAAADDPAAPSHEER
jgi:hypothetical protein